MKILGIETSCDETAASIVEDGTKILSNVVVSQIDIFAAYGGVIPEVAARSHLEAILPVIDKAIEDANLTWDDIDAIAVTHTPGLLGSLLIGTLTARTLAILHKKPLYAVHHLKSHIYANWLKEEDGILEQHGESLKKASDSTDFYSTSRVVKMKTAEICPRYSKSSFPLLAMVISGGHTQILYMKEHNSFEIIGTTLDDAIGECFDKVAKILGLPYPGGPAISKLAKKGDRHRYHFPHPKVDDLNFSFSGLKTAVLRAVQKECGVPLSFPSYELKNRLSEAEKADFAASFEQTATDILLEKLKIALKNHPEVKSIVFAGGVSANQFLREQAIDMFRTGSQNVFSKERPEVIFPEKSFSGDNGAMVASAAFFEIQSGTAPTDPYSLDIAPRSPITKNSCN